MDTTAEWISAHALSLWAIVLACVLVGADLAWRRVVRHRANEEARLLRPLTVGATVMVAVLISVAIAVAVRREDGLTQFDADLAGDLRDNMPLPLLRGIAWLTHLGDPPLVAIATLVVALLLGFRREWRMLVTWLLALVGTATINSVLKAWFQRERPLHDHGFIVEHSYSFPSGHASGSMVFYGMLAYVLLRSTPPRWHRLIVAIAVTLITVVGISRILLQVHYFSDVVAGYTTGLAWLMLCIGSAEAWRLRHRG
ncbi:MAG TPA: phosphatase PAP2 family protein [Luteibacter sp.]|nr:phosphatase PAP2 family protein [Luteibacter sp.]